MTPPELLGLSARALASAIREKATTASAAMQAVLERAQAIQPTLNAYLRIDAEAALAAARAADRELADGTVRGPLHGVPMAHKDMYYRAGVASSGGSRILGERPAASTATVLERLDAAGALQYGVLNLAEFAFGPTGHNWHYGHCRNPWDTDRITGGSSSGSGATIAARANYAALGSDTGGSIRLPATFCGTVGLMPTYGRVSRAGAMPLSFSLDRVGPLTRTVEDAALVLAQIAGADPRDPTSEARPVPDYLATLGRGVKGLRIGRPTRFFYDHTDAAIRERMDQSIEVFRALGATIVDVDLPPVEPIEAALLIVIATEAAALHARDLRRRGQDYSDQVRTRLQQGFAIPAPSYVEALAWRGEALRRFCDTVFASCDLLHAPVVGFRTPTIAQTDVGGSPDMMKVVGQVTRLTRPINYLGLPSLAVPVGFCDDGMPTAMQLIGRPFDEPTLLAAGHAYQGATDWHGRAPDL